MPHRLLRNDAVTQKTGAPKTTRDEWDDFPKPIKIGPRAIAWIEEEIDAWIDERIRASRGKEANAQ